MVEKYPIITSLSYPKKGAMGKTGNWRVFKPILDSSKCVRCLRCWVFCPEATVIRREDNSVEIDYDYCKGCGICAQVCAVKAITMVREGEDR